MTQDRRDKETGWSPQEVAAQVLRHVAEYRQSEAPIMGASVQATELLAPRRFCTSRRGGPACEQVTALAAYAGSRGTDLGGAPYPNAARSRLLISATVHRHAGA